MGWLMSTIAIGAAAASVSACAAGPAHTVDPDSLLRVMAVDYNRAADLVVLEICRLGEPSVGAKGRVCGLALADASSAVDGQDLALRPLGNLPGHQYASATIIPSGQAVYAGRFVTAEWQRGLYATAPTTIVRIDLVSGEEVEIARGVDGLIGVVDVFLGDAGEERVLMLETLSPPGANGPSGSRFQSVVVRDGRVVPGTSRVFPEIGGWGYGLKIAGFGYVRQAQRRDQAGQSTPTVFAQSRSEFAQGRYRVFPDLNQAVEHVLTQEPATPPAVAQGARTLARRTSNAAPYDTVRVRNIEPSPEAFVFDFGVRDAAFFPEDSPYGSFAAGYDLAGGGVAAPIGASSNPAAAPLAFFSGDKPPFALRAKVTIDLSAFAAGRF